MDGTRPYFFSVGQSSGPIRSKPLIPRRAASRQQSSSGAPRANTPRVNPCLIRPLRAGGVAAVDCPDCGAWPLPTAAPATNDAVTAPRNSLRRMVIPRKDRGCKIREQGCQLPASSFLRERRFMRRLVSVVLVVLAAAGAGSHG